MDAALLGNKIVFALRRLCPGSRVTQREDRSSVRDTLGIKDLFSDGHRGCHLAMFIHLEILYIEVSE